MKWNVPSCRELARAQLSVLEGAAEQWPGDPGSLGKTRRLNPNTCGPFGNFPHLPTGSRMGVVPVSGFLILEASLGPVCQPLGTSSTRP